jgi:hypothetical protein
MEDRNSGLSGRNQHKIGEVSAAPILGTGAGSTRLPALKLSPADPAGGAARPGANSSSSSSSSRNGRVTPPVGVVPVERRMSPRYHCEGTAELRQDNSEVRNWGTFADISVHGCYVERTNPCAVGTKVSMVLEANGIRFNTKGVVRVSYPGNGVGVAFTEMSEEDRAQLRQLLRLLFRPSPILGISAQRATAYPPVSAPRIDDPMAALDALTQFFEERQLLTHEEFLRVLRSSQSG